MRLFKPMTDEQLARNDRVLAVVLTIGGIFLAWDFFRSAQQGIPALGLVWLPEWPHLCPQGFRNTLTHHVDAGGLGKQL